MFHRKGKKVHEVVAEATRKYDDNVWEQQEKAQAQTDKVNLAIRFRRAQWLFKPDHHLSLTTDHGTAAHHQLEDHVFIKQHNTLHHRAYKYVKDAIFPPKARVHVEKFDGTEHFARKKEHNRQFKVKFDLLHEALDRLSKPKMPAHHEDALYMPGYVQSITPEYIKYQEDYLVENRPIPNPPGIHRVVEELKSIEETTAIIKSQNGDAYCPGTLHKYLGQE
jgi:hypothetical protein